MIYNGKKQTTMGQKKPHRQYRELSNKQRWRLLMGGMQMEAGGVKGLERCGKSYVEIFSNLFLKMLTKGTAKTEAYYFVFHNPHRKSRLSPTAVDITLGCPLRPRRVRRRKGMFGSTVRRIVNILNAVIRSAQSCRLCKERRPSRCSLCSQVK